MGRRGSGVTHGGCPWGQRHRAPWVLPPFPASAPIHPPRAHNLSGPAQSPPPPGSLPCCLSPASGTFWAVVTALPGSPHAELSAAGTHAHGGSPPGSDVSPEGLRLGSHGGGWPSTPTRVEGANGEGRNGWSPSLCQLLLPSGGVGGWAEPYCRSLKAQCPARGVQRRPANRCASGWQPLARPAAPEQHCPAETLHEPQTRAMGMILTLLGATFKKIKKKILKSRRK